MRRIVPALPRLHAALVFRHAASYRHHRGPVARLLDCQDRRPCAWRLSRWATSRSPLAANSSQRCHRGLTLGRSSRSYTAPRGGRRDAGNASPDDPARGARLDVRKPLADIAVRAIAAAIRVRRRRLTHDRTEHTAWASVAIAMADDFRFRLLDHCSLNILSSSYCNEIMRPFVPGLRNFNFLRIDRTACQPCGQL